MDRMRNILLVLGLGLGATGCTSASGDDYATDCLWALIFGDDDDDEHPRNEKRPPCDRNSGPVHNPGERPLPPHNTGMGR